MKEFGPPGGGRASLAPPLGSANASDNSKCQYTVLSIRCLVCRVSEIETLRHLRSQAQRKKLNPGPKKARRASHWTVAVILDDSWTKLQNSVCSTLSYGIFRKRDTGSYLRTLWRKKCFWKNKGRSRHYWRACWKAKYRWQPRQLLSGGAACACWSQGTR